MMVEESENACAHRLVAEWLAAGVSVPEIERRLGEKGMLPAESSRLVDRVLGGAVADVAATESRQTRTGLLGGMLWCVVGLGLLVGGWAVFTATGKVRGALLASGVAALVRGVILIVRART